MAIILAILVMNQLEKDQMVVKYYNKYHMGLRIDKEEINRRISPRGIKMVGNLPAELEMLIFPEEKFKLIRSTDIEIKGVLRHIHTVKPVQ